MMPIKSSSFLSSWTGKPTISARMQVRRWLGFVGAAVRATKSVPVGHYAGFEITVEYKPLEKVFHAHLVGEATHTTELGNDAAGNMIRFQNVVSALPQDLNRLHGSLEQLTKQLTNAEEELKQPFLQEPGTER